MIKTFEQYKEHDKELVRTLWKEIILTDKDINGFEVGGDMSGAIMWSGEYYGLYATPYWEFCDDLPIEIFDNNGDTIEDQTIELDILSNLTDIDRFIKWYFEIIDKVTKKLNKRREIVEILINIYDDLPKNIQDKISYIESEDPFINMKTDELINVYEIIEKNYPELISANKYNL